MLLLEEGLNARQDLAAAIFAVLAGAADGLQLVQVQALGTDARG